MLHSSGPTLKPNRSRSSFLQERALLFDQVGDDQHSDEIHSHLGRVFGRLGPKMTVRRALLHLQRAEALLSKTSEEHSLGWLYWGLATSNLQTLHVNDALAASQKAMEIFARLGNRKSWTRAASNQIQYLMVKGKLAQAIGLIDEIVGAASGLADPTAFKRVHSMCGWFWMLMRDTKQAMHIIDWV